MYSHQKKKKILTFKMLQITESISWSKESALQSQAMENTAWHILAPKWSPWDCILSTHNKAGFSGVQLQHVVLLWHLNLEMREHSEFSIFRMYCTRKAQSISSALIVQSFWNTEMAQQLCQIPLCALERPRQAGRWLNVDYGSPTLPGLPSKGWDGDTTQLGLQQAES